MLHGAGACMILLSGCLFSVKALYKLKQRCRNTAELARGIFLLKHEIIFSGREMWDAIGAVADSLSGEIGELFGRMHVCLTKYTAKTLEDVWKETASDVLLPKSALEYMASFTRKAGTFSEEQELQHLEQAEQMLSDIHRSEEKIIEKNKTLIYTAGLGGSCAVFILLL